MKSEKHLSTFRSWFLPLIVAAMIFSLLQSCSSNRAPKELLLDPVNLDSSLNFKYFASLLEWLDEEYIDYETNRSFKSQTIWEYPYSNADRYRIHKEDSMSKMLRLEYNQNGQVTSIENSSYEGDDKVRLYYERGRLVFISYPEKDEYWNTTRFHKLTTCIRFEYDSFGNLMSQYEYKILKDHSRRLYKHTSYHYTGTKKDLKVVAKTVGCLGPDTTLREEQQIYKFVEGRLVYHEQSGEVGIGYEENTLVQTYQYHPKFTHRLKRETFHNKKSNSHMEFEYHYDKQGRSKKNYEYTYLGDRKIGSSYTVAERYEGGVSEIFYYETLTSTEPWYTVKSKNVLNEQGDIIELKYTSEGGTISDYDHWKNEYEYDQHGNRRLVKRVYIPEEGNDWKFGYFSEDPNKDYHLLLYEIEYLGEGELVEEESAPPKDESAYRLLHTVGGI